MSKQTTSQLMMVRPASFQFNIETAVSNAFQKSLENLSAEEIEQKAIIGLVCKLMERCICIQCVRQIDD